jgi:hypothetical protein
VLDIKFYDLGLFQKSKKLSFSKIRFRHNLATVFMDFSRKISVYVRLLTAKNLAIVYFGFSFLFQSLSLSVLFIP